MQVGFVLPNDYLERVPEWDVSMDAVRNRLGMIIRIALDTYVNQRQCVPHTAAVAAIDSARNAATMLGLSWNSNIENLLIDSIKMGEQLKCFDSEVAQPFTPPPRTAFLATGLEISWGV